MYLEIYPLENCIWRAPINLSTNSNYNTKCMETNIVRLFQARSNLESKGVPRTCYKNIRKMDVCHPLNFVQNEKTDRRLTEGRM